MLNNFERFGIHFGYRLFLCWCRDGIQLWQANKGCHCGDFPSSGRPSPAIRQTSNLSCRVFCLPLLELDRLDLEMSCFAEEDLVIILCGPKGFVDDVCQPLLRELKYSNVLTMW